MQRLAQLKSEAAALAASAASSKVTAASAVVAPVVSAVRLQAMSRRSAKSPQPAMLRQSATLQQPGQSSRQSQKSHHCWMNFWDRPLRWDRCRRVACFGRLGIVLRRRKQPPVKAVNMPKMSSGATTGHLNHACCAFPETGDFTATAARGCFASNL